MATYDRYSLEQEEFLKANCKLMSRKELASKFNEIFGLNKSTQTIKVYCNRRGWNSSNDGLFKKGYKSWQDGLSGDEYRNHYSEETWNKCRSPLDHRRLKLGDETIRHGQLMIVVSVDENLPFEKRIEYKHRIVWENTNGSIPIGYRILHLDNNKMNCDLDNLRCIPSAFIPILNKNHWLGKGREMTLTAIAWCELWLVMRDCEVARL